jgi:hypothetical protein
MTKKHDFASQIAESLAAEEPPAEPSPCAVCGQYDGEMVPAGNARAHEACATARRDVIAKVKARA